MASAAQNTGDKDKPDSDDPTAPTAPGGGDDANVNGNSNSNGNVNVAPVTRKATTTTVEDDEESDWEELDEVLDDFNKPKQPTNAQPATSGPGRSEPTTNAPAAAAAADDEFDEEAFLKQLEADMANLIGGGGGGGAAGAGPSSADMQAANELIDKEIDELSKQLQESGIEPEKFLKSLIAESIASGGSKNDSSSSSAGAGANQTTARESFQDTIRRTMERMQESGERAAAAAAEDDVPEDLLAQLLKAIEAGAAAGGDDMDLNKMFMGMMEQLSNKEMLYEPMKELHTKFGPWLEENRTKVSAEDLARYETQARVVGEIVAKFEEEGYSDDKPECRAYIWDRMQEMQAAGSPPDDLIANPLMEELKGTEGGGEGQAPPECPQQ
ncbi:hypothetical protein VTN77DRAFT_7511 [Rasamsonia byssochlamydoides]|uniref:uncharacterized protein n=1 Tax=Rasamsonia byssochlamydoides TaxID=89139 RepID=UPI00374350DA